MNRMKKKKIKDIAIIVICLFASYQMVGNVIQPLIEVKTENADLKKDISDVTDSNKLLQKSLDQSENSKEMEEGYIRERFHMSKKDEIIFVFPDDE